LVHPASCDSLSTSGAKEDHVSMGKKTGGGIVAAVVLVAVCTCC
jgi:histidine ammonia-lyase